MTSPNKRKGDAAEREVAALIHQLLGWPARRMLGAGRQDDVGDIWLPAELSTVIQVADWRDALRAVREKPIGAESQRINANATHAATFVRLWGGTYRVALTPEQWATYARESQ